MAFLRWIGSIFDGRGFVVRSRCGAWTPSLIVSTQLADLVIALSYIFIPICILVVWRRRRDDLARPAVLVWFSSFILFCGWTHINDILVFYWPAYRFFTLAKIATAVASAGTSVILPGFVRYIGALPSWDRLYAETNRLQAEIFNREIREAEIRRKCDAIEEELTRYKSRLATVEATRKQAGEIDDLRRAVEDLRRS